MEEAQRERNKGGRPTVMGEPTRRIGPFAVGESLYAWLVTQTTGPGAPSQGEIFRRALLRMKTSVRRSQAKAARTARAEAS